MITFLTLIQVFILKLAGCNYILLPLPDNDPHRSDDVAVKWTCRK